jgi:hypothetical protein
LLQQSQCGAIKKWYTLRQLSMNEKRNGTFTISLPLRNLRVLCQS